MTASFEQLLQNMEQKEKSTKKKQVQKKKSQKRKKLASERGKLSEQKRGKNAPREFHSTGAVGISKPSILKKERYSFSDAARTNRFDPRFQTEKPKKARMHTYDPRYKFLEDMLRNELDEFYKEYSNAQDETDRLEFKRKIDRHETRLRDIETNKLRYEIQKDYYEKQAEVIEKTGQKPHMLSKTRLDALVKKKQFDDLKQDGKLEKYLKKKRKRNFAKDVKKMRPDGGPAKKRPRKA